MLLAAVDFDNLHQVLRVLYDEMMPLCSNMTGGSERDSRAGCAVLCSRQSVAVARTCRTHRRVLAPAPLCAGAVHHVLSHVRIRDYQHGTVASGERVQPAYGNADFRHERVPGAERPTGI